MTRLRTLSRLVVAISVAQLVNAASGQIVYRTVALTGQAAPGAPAGSTFSGFVWPVINSSGKVAFTGSLTDGNGIDFSNDSGIWSDSSGALGLVARAGNVAPGSSQKFDNLFGISIVLDSNNNVTFTSNLVNAVGTSGAGIWSGSANALGVVALTGMHAPGTSGVANFSSFNAPDDNASDLVFAAGLTGADTAGSNTGIWTFQGNTFQLAARAGFAAPNTESGTVFSQFENYVVNASQTLAFIADLTLTNGTDRGIWRGLPSSLSLVARRNMAAPGTNGAFTNFVTLSMNNSGTLLFDGGYAGPSGSAAGLWLATSGSPATISLVAQVGTPAPGVGGAVFTQFFDHYIGANNQIVLLARDTTTTNGIWAGAANALSLIAHEGSLAPGTNGAHFSSLSTPEINAAGQIAFFATLDTGAQGIWATDLSGGLQLIARVGGALTVAPGDTRQMSFLSFQAGGGNQDGLPSSLNDSGVLTFHAIFTDSTAGVFTATVPSATPPAVTIHKNPTTADVRFTTTIGHNYSVEYSDSLTTPVWHPVGSLVIGSGSPATVTDPQPGTRRFYHVIQQ